MVMECHRCWWIGLSPVPVFFDAADFHNHQWLSHQLPEYEAQEIIAAPWIAVGFTYQAAFTDAGELVLACPYSPEETEVSANADPVGKDMNLALTTPQRVLWEQGNAQYGVLSQAIECLSPVGSVRKQHKWSEAGADAPKIRVQYRSHFGNSMQSRR